VRLLLATPRRKALRNLLDLEEQSRQRPNPRKMILLKMQTRNPRSKWLAEVRVGVYFVREWWPGKGLVWDLFCKIQRRLMFLLGADQLYWNLSLFWLVNSVVVGQLLKQLYWTAYYYSVLNFVVVSFLLSFHPSVMICLIWLLWPGSLSLFLGGILLSPYKVFFLVVYHESIT
jgi:hypothetical protein